MSTDEADESADCFLFTQMPNKHPSITHTERTGSNSVFLSFSVSHTLLIRISYAAICTAVNRLLQAQQIIKAQYITDFPQKNADKCLVCSKLLGAWVCALLRASVCMGSV